MSKVSFNYKDKETDSLLADDIIVDSQPSLTPEILGANISPMYNVEGATEGMAP